MRSPTAGVSGVLVALLVAGAGLTACGSPGAVATRATSPPTTSPPSPQALAAVVLAANRTAGLTSGFEMSFQRSSSDTSMLPLDAHGVVDFRGPSATIRIDLPASSGGTERMVFLPGTVFFKPPPSSPPLQAGRPWIFANFADIAKYKVNFPPYIVQIESINPSFAVSEIGWGATAAAPAGTVTFHGQRAKAYSVTVGLQQALAHASGANGVVFGLTLASEISASGSASPTATAQVWVDPQGRLVGAQIVPIGAGIGTLTLALDHFGMPVQADKPRRSTVVDLAAMIPGGEREALNGGDADGA